MTYEEMMRYCHRHRESDGLCRISSACSGPCQSNLARDYKDEKENITIYRGGNYGSCRFEVTED